MDFNRSNLTDIQTSSECPVCLESFVAHRILSCGHFLCHNCCLLLFRSLKNFPCPLCRSLFDKDSIYYLSVKNVLQKLKSNNFTDAEEVIKTVKIGDLIEINCWWYSHWMIFIGEYENLEHQVIHLTGDNNVSGCRSGSIGQVGSWLPSISGMQLSGSNACIKMTDIREAIRGSCRINNLLDDQYKPLPPEEIRHRALTGLGYKPKYSIFLNNCEHFVTDCRYGRPSSRQSMALTSSVAGVVGGILGGGWTPAGVAFFGAAAVYKYWNR